MRSSNVDAVSTMSLLSLCESQLVVVCMVLWNWRTSICRSASWLAVRPMVWSPSMFVILSVARP